MFRFNIGSASYVCPSDWGEISLRQAAEIEARCKDLPAEVKEYYRVNENPEKAETHITAENLRILETFERDLVAYLADIPETTLTQASDREIVAIYEQSAALFALSFIFAPIYEPQGLEKFQFDGSWYAFPSSGKDILGITTPLHKCQAKVFCDASDIAVSGDLSFAPLFVAVLVSGGRDDVVLQNAKDFKNLPASIYFEALAQLSAAHEYLAKEYPYCYATGRGSGNGDSSTWGDMLLFVADDRPSELPAVERMGCYDFVRILQSKLKRQKQQWELGIALRGIS